MCALIINYVIAYSITVTTEKTIGKWWWDMMEASCNEAAAEEKKIAIEKGSLHEGVPAITVIVDGGWSKRSHKHSYNAKSGVAIIIGKETGKLLYVGVRNKYCTVCTQADRAGKEPQEHDCQKNWDGPSSSMETDMLVEGFKQAESKYGLRYIQFIGDGDSSVYPTLLSQVPVWGHAIRKIECSNHAVKYYRSALENLVKEKPQYKGKGKLTEGMRKKLTKAARCAIKMRSKEENKSTAIKLLQEDLHNGPLHCFGIHGKCKPDYCKIVQNRQAQLTNSGVSPIQVASIPDSPPVCSESLSADSSIDDVSDDIADIVEQEIAFWNDATSDDNGADDDSDSQIPPEKLM